MKPSSFELIPKHDRVELHSELMHLSIGYVRGQLSPNNLLEDLLKAAVGGEKQMTDQTQSDGANAVRKDVPKKEKGSRDWLALSISLVSLVCSGLTAWFNVLLQQDDIRIVVDRLPEILRDEKGNMFGMNGVQLTILNAGNRSAVVTRVIASAYQRENENGSRECKNPQEGRPFPVVFFNDFKPVVIKPGEIQFVVTNTVPVFPWNEVKADDAWDMALPKDLHGSHIDYFLVCLKMTVTAPDSPAIQWEAPMEMIKKDVSMSYLPTDLYDKDKPITVLKTRHTILGF